MTKCPNCGSTAQAQIIEVEFEEHSHHVIKYTTYYCGCKHLWLTTTVYRQESEEHIEDFVV
jgi:hypothetical protein